MGRVLDLRFPLAGVRRGGSYYLPSQEVYPAPWACNVRSLDPLELRARGGSRPGLTALGVDFPESSVTGMVSLPVSSADGSASVLGVVAGGSLGVVVDGVYSSPVGDLLTVAGETLLTEAGANLLADTGAVPDSAHLCVRGPKIYAISETGIVCLDSLTGVVDQVVASRGEIPAGAVAGCFYRDRLVLIGADNVVYASRQGDPTDWDYGADADDPGRAVAFQLADAQEHGVPPVALMPFEDRILFIGAVRSLWAIHGDPATGVLRTVSRGVGIVGRTAWCVIQDSRAGDSLAQRGVAFLGDDGLYMLSPEGAGPVPLSKTVLPQEFRSDSAAVSLVFSPRERGIYVFLTPAASAGLHWFVDLVHGAFWPMRLQRSHQPTVACLHDGDVVLAGQDGHLRRVGGETDDGMPISSHVLFGPLRVGSVGAYGRILWLVAGMATGSGPVTWRIVVGQTAEDAARRAKTAVEAFMAGSSYAEFVAMRGDWTAGRSVSVYPHLRAEWCVIWLESAATWAFESMRVETTESGRVR